MNSLPANLLDLFQRHFDFLLFIVLRPGLDLGTDPADVLLLRAKYERESVSFFVAPAQLSEALFLFESQARRRIVNDFLMSVEFQHGVTEAGQFAHAVWIKLEYLFFFYRKKSRQKYAK